MAGKKLFAILIIISFFLIPGQAVRAETYYLDAQKGNDRARGDCNAPWKSLKKAVETAREGDVVMMASGEYGTLTDSAERKEFITFAAGAGQMPVLEDVSALRTTSLRLKGLKVAGTVNAYGSKNFEMLNCKVEFAGKRYSAPANLVDIRHSLNAVVKGCVICNGRTGIKADVSANALISGNVIYNLAVDGVTATPTKGLVFEFNHVHGLNQSYYVLKSGSTRPGFETQNKTGAVRDMARGNLFISDLNSPAGTVLAYINFDEPKNFENIQVMGLSIKPSTGLGMGDLAVRVCSESNGADRGEYGEIAVFECKPNTVNKKYNSKLPDEIRQIKAARSVALLKKGNFPAANFSITEWNFSNGAHQDFLVISGMDILIRNNIFHDGGSQAIFTSPARAANVIIENNLVYDLGGNNLTNLTLGGKAVIRNNTFIGSLREGRENDLHNPSHFFGIVRVNAAEPNAVIEIVNNIVAGELSPVGVYNDYNIVHRQSRRGMHTMVLSGPGAVGYVFERNFFEGEVNFQPGHRGVLNFKPAVNSPAVNFGNAGEQPKTSLGCVGAQGFIQDNGAARDDKHHSAGAIERN
jgi:hypothetical protein